MNKANLKTYAPQARKDFMAATAARANALGLALDDQGQLPTTTAQAEAAISLGPAYRHVPDFLARFPDGVPSMRECTSLTIDADVTFGARVRCVGDVTITGTGIRRVPDGTVLSGRH